ncbi:hypothetical protein FACS189431_4250 [Alphaproteobacteria bacterium]|nr:hypothetical protein FACS189431_4250 [Alphaproteobacteria bacterium]
MPNAFFPEYNIWKREFERFGLDEDTILVGHSCGGGFLTRYLSENDIKVGKVVLVAPWLGRHDKEMDKTFFDFTIAKDLASKTKGLTIFYSKDDDILEAVEKIKSAVDNVKIVEFTNKGHFTFTDLGTHEFPELLNEIMN